MGLLLAIEAKKKHKKHQAVDDQMKQGKSGQKGQRELKNLLTSMNVEVGLTKSRNVRSGLWPQKFPWSWSIVLSWGLGVRSRLIVIIYHNG